MPTLTDVTGTILPIEPVCLFSVSKDLEGTAGEPSGDVDECRECVTLDTRQSLVLRVRRREECDDESFNLDGTITIKSLRHLYAGGNGQARGAHSGTVVWGGPSIRASGRVNGVTNAGTHRVRPLDDCERCDAPVMQGLLVARIRTGPGAPPGSVVVAAYKLRIDPQERGFYGGVQGTLEGALMVDCDF